MEEMQVMVAKNGKRKWSLEQKLAIVGEFEGGVNAEELCRKYDIHKQMPGGTKMTGAVLL